MHSLATIWRRWADDAIVAGMVARADIARGMANFRDAAILYQDVVRVRPGMAAIHVQCGHMFKEAGDFESAAQHYEHARRLCPNDADLHLHIGHLHKVSGRIEDARGSYRRAATLSPGWAEPLAELAALAPTPHRS